METTDSTLHELAPLQIAASVSFVKASVSASNGCRGYLRSNACMAAAIAR